MPTKKKKSGYIYLPTKKAISCAILQLLCVFPLNLTNTVGVGWVVSWSSGSNNKRLICKSKPMHQRDVTSINYIRQACSLFFNFQAIPNSQ